MDTIQILLLLGVVLCCFNALFIAVRAMTHKTREREEILLRKTKSILKSIQLCAEGRHAEADKPGEYHDEKGNRIPD